MLTGITNNDIKTDFKMAAISTDNALKRCTTCSSHELITLSEELPCPRVTAFSLTSLFLERFWGELRISFRSYKPVIKTKTPKNGIFDFFNEVSFSFVTSYIYNALMNGAELPFSR